MEPNDEKTTIETLKRAMLRFAEDRDWLQFHSPKNLAIGIAVEAAELLEHFRWADTESSHAMLADGEKASAVAEELADVVLFVVQFANVARIDIASAVHDKLAKNAERYPIDKARGNSRKYTEF